MKIEKGSMAEISHLDLAKMNKEAETNVKNLIKLYFPNLLQPNSQQQTPNQSLMPVSNTLQQSFTKRSQNNKSMNNSRDQVISQNSEEDTDDET